MTAPPAVQLPLRPPRGARFAFHGFLERRLAANLEHWLLVAPQATPAMLEMFRDRDRLPLASRQA